MNSYSGKSKFYRSILAVLVLLIGSSLITALLSIRSWYKPAIYLRQISPVTVILNKDTLVIDKVGTDEAREKARLNAIKNSDNNEILEIDNQAKAKDLEKLKLAVHIVRHSISETPAYIPPINSNISLDTQDFLLHLNYEKFQQLLLSSDFEKELTESDFFDFVLDEGFRKAVSKELLSLSELERKQFFESLQSIRKQLDEEEKIKKTLGKNFIATIKNSDYELIFKKTFVVQKLLLDLGIVTGLSREKLHENIQILFPNLSSTELYLIQKLIDATTSPNIQINWDKVHKLEQDAMQLVKPIEVKLRKGSLLAEKGNIVPARNFYYLENLHMLHADIDWKEIRSNYYILCFLVLSILIYIFVSRFRKYSLRHCILFLVVPATVSVIIAAIALWGVDKLALAPVAMISILLTIFYSPVMAGVIVTIICFFLAKTVDMNFWQVLPQFVGSIVAIYMVRKAHQREDLTKAATQIAIVQVIVFLITVVIAVENFKVPTVLIVASLYAIGAIGSVLLSIAVLPYLESSLKLITPFKLAELSNSSQPLLKRLKEEAPGTYEHSLHVSRFSEEACLALGINYDLARVGILYHDIGKMHSPEHFIENSMGKANPHVELNDPLKSAAIILAHIPEGIKLAKKYNLPQSIIDFIPMHQGTTITNYFYIQAVEKYGKENINADDYRYPGPKPNTKETGIAMVADSAEAALRSIKDLADEDAARDMINHIINDRLDEGELDDSGLSRADLEKVSAAFLSVWRSQNHERIKYPDQV